MSSLFDSFFLASFSGVWPIFRMRAEDHGLSFYKERGIRGWIGAIVNLFLIAIGFYFRRGHLRVILFEIVASFIANIALFRHLSKVSC